MLSAANLECPPQGGPQPAALDRRPLALQGIRHIITPSAFSREGLLRCPALRPRDVSVVPYGVDTNVFRPMRTRAGTFDRERAAKAKFRKQVNWFPDEPEVVLYFAVTRWLHNGRDVFDLLKAFAVAVGEMPYLRLALKVTNDAVTEEEVVDVLWDACKAGNSTPWKPSNASPKTYKLCRRNIAVDFQRHISQTEMARMYRAADIFIDVDRSRASALTLLEAIASGVSVITTGGGAAEEALNSHAEAFTRWVRSKSIRNWIPQNADVWRKATEDNHKPPDPDASEDVLHRLEIVPEPVDLVRSLLEGNSQEERQRTGYARSLGNAYVAKSAGIAVHADKLLGVLSRLAAEDEESEAAH